MARPSGRSLLYGTASGVGVLLVVAVFLAGLSVKERDNRFCVSCHLHETKFTRLIAASVTDLAGSHHAKDRRIGCIACHGGSDTLMQVRVWSIAGFDTLKFLVGAYGEPTVMRLSIRDVDCRRCHTPISREGAAVDLAEPSSNAEAGSAAETSYMTEAPVPRGGRISFHGFRDHDSVDVRCVGCHRAHTTEADATEQFISRAIVEPICRECHRPL